MEQKTLYAGTIQYEHTDISHIALLEHRTGNEYDLLSSTTSVIRSVQDLCNLLNDGYKFSKDQLPTGELKLYFNDKFVSGVKHINSLDSFKAKIAELKEDNKK